MSFGEQLEITLDYMEETRFKKKYARLIQRLSKKLHFTYTELESILLIYYKLHKDNPEKLNGGMTKIQFRDILHCGFDITDNLIMDRISMALDKGPSPYVSMEVWATALSLYLKGTMEEKIHYCFSVYDSIGEGLIGRENMFQLLRTSLLSPGSDEEAEEAAKDMIEVLSKKMDLDRDGKISFDDYRQTVLNQPMMLEALGHCLPSKWTVHAFLTTFIPDYGKMKCT